MVTVADINDFTLFCCHLVPRNARGKEGAAGMVDGKYFCIGLKKFCVLLNLATMSKVRQGQYTASMYGNCSNNTYDS